MLFTEFPEVQVKYAGFRDAKISSKENDLVLVEYNLPC